MPEKPEDAGEANPQDAPSGSDDTRRKFREALERKKAAGGRGADHRDGGRKQPTSHGPVENRREFRRKSG